MEIEKLESPGEKLLIRFSDLTDTHCSLYATDHIKQGKSTTLLSFDIDDDYVKFTQEDIKQLLPYLQNFAETGTLEPATESPLQGDEYTLKQLTEFQERIQHAFHQETKDCVLCQTVILLSRFASNKVREKVQELLRTYNSEERTPLQGDEKRIQALVETSARMNYRNYRYEQLLKEWKKFGTSELDCKHPDELAHLTDEIIRESGLSVEGFNEIEKAKRGEAYYQRQCDKQVDEIADLEEQLETMQEAGVAMAENIVNQGNRIKELQNLVREWRLSASRGYGGNEESCMCPDCCPDLHEQTAQLLQEEQTNDPTS